MYGSDKFRNIKNQGKIIFNSQFLSNFSKVERYEFLQFCHRRTYNTNEFVYHQGDPGTGMYFIESGSVQLIIDSDEQNKNFSHTLQASDSFGLLSIGYEFRRFATAKCVEDSTLLGFFKPDFETLKKRHPQIAMKFMESVATVAMRQLSIAINELSDSSDAKRIIALQYDSLHKNTENK